MLIMIYTGKVFLQQLRMFTAASISELKLTQLQNFYEK